MRVKNLIPRSRWRLRVFRESYALSVTGGGVDGMAGRIKIYSTPGCGLCDQARKYLAGKGADVDLVDVTRDKAALQEMKELSGGVRTAPVISVCDQVLIGFNKKDLEEAASCLK